MITITDTPAASRPRVLSIGRDAALLQTRKFVLGIAGFEVVSNSTANTSDEIRALLQQEGGFRVCLLGQSVPLDERLAIAHWIRQNAPSVGVAMFHYPGESFDANDCDAVLAVPAHPERMIAAVQRALKKAALRSSEGPTGAQT